MKTEKSRQTRYKERQHKMGLKRIELLIDPADEDTFKRKAELSRERLKKRVA